MSSIPQEVLGKSVDVIPRQLEKLVANTGAYTEFAKKNRPIQTHKETKLAKDIVIGYLW